MVHAFCADQNHDNASVLGCTPMSGASDNCDDHANNDDNSLMR